MAAMACPEIFREKQQSALWRHGFKTVGQE
jgi:hypothetical protein